MSDETNSSVEVGRGIDRPRLASDLAPDNSSVPAVTMAPGTEAKPEIWQDEPCLEGQHTKPGLFKIDRVEVKILDLTKSEDVLYFSDLMTEQVNGKLKRTILKVEHKFVEDLQNWKVFIILQNYKFKRVVPTPATSEEKKQ